MIRDGQLPQESIILIQRKCQLCYQPTFQTACLVKSIIKDLIPRLAFEKEKFNIETQNLKNLGDQQNQDEQNYKNGFYRLISLIFDSQFQHSKQYRNCKHKQIEKILISKLSCNDQILDKICDLAVFQFGQRNYQLEVLSFQIKTFPKTIEQTINNSVKIKPEKQKSLRRSIQLDQQKEQMIKFQQSGNQQLNEKIKKKNKIIKKKQRKYSKKRSNANQQLEVSQNHIERLAIQNLQNNSNSIKIEEPINQTNIYTQNRINIDHSQQRIDLQQMETFNAQFLTFTHMLPLFYNQHHHH